MISYLLDFFFSKECKDVFVTTLSLSRFKYVAE